MKTPRYRFLAALSFGLLFLFWGGYYYKIFYFLDLGNLKMYDRLHKFLPPLTPSGKVVLVSISGSRDFSRSDYGRLIQEVAKKNAKVIALDIRFKEERDAGEDESLVNAVKAAGNIILVEDVELRGDAQFRNRPFPILAKEAKDIGAPFLQLDFDQVVRGVRLYKDDFLSGTPYTAFSALIYMALSENNSNQIILKKNTNELYLGAFRIPVDMQNYMFIRFKWHPFTQISAENVLSGSYPDDFFKDKGVIIYADGDVHDRFRVPFAAGLKYNKLSGGLIHAMALETLLSGRFILPVYPLQWVLTILCACFLPWLFAFRQFRKAFLWCGIIAAIYIGITIFAMLFMRKWVPIMLPVSYIFIYGVIVLLRDFLITRSFFTQFIPSHQVDRIIQEGNISQDTRKVQATILFSDLRGYTTWTEQEDSIVVMKQLREYIDCLSPIVHKFGGQLMDYQGDGTMAIFLGESKFRNHAVEGSLAALEIDTAFQALQKCWRDTGKKDLEVGIGLATGEVALGMMGGTLHRQFTAIGDASNTAARLQGLSQILNADIVLSESTVLAAGDTIKVKYLENVQLKGKQQAVSAYHLIGVKES